MKSKFGGFGIGILKIVELNSCIFAAKIFPVVKNQHLLLCTLLIGNSLAMEVICVSRGLGNYFSFLFNQFGYFCLKKKFALFL